jgi:hypothetical protein
MTPDFPLCFRIHIVALLSAFAQGTPWYMEADRVEAATLAGRGESKYESALQPCADR